MRSKTLLTFLTGLAVGGVLATAVVSSSGGFRRCPTPSFPSAGTRAAGSGAETMVPK